MNYFNTKLYQLNEYESDTTDDQCSIYGWDYLGAHIMTEQKVKIEATLISFLDLEGFTGNTFW